MSKPRTGWVNWWWVHGGMWGPYVKTMWTTRRVTAKQLHGYDVSNGAKVGRVHRIKVTIEEPPK